MRKPASIIILTITLILAACGAASHTLPESMGDAGQLPINEAPTQAPLSTIVPLPTETPELSPFPTLLLPSLTPFPDDEIFAIGQSVEGREIWTWQFGSGPYDIVLIGGMHGSFEGNTVVLAEQLVDYFRQNPDAVLLGVRLLIIPTANPDGMERDPDFEGRFNAHGVDLNRNWGCEWEDTAFLRNIPVDPGPRPFSEPETLALRSFFIAEPPDAVIFYHSAVGGVFMGECGGDPPAAWLGNLLEISTGYPHDDFDFYEVSGDATNWLAERGIPAATIELYSRNDPEFDQNLAGVMALQCYFARLGVGSATDFFGEGSALNRFCGE